MRKKKYTVPQTEALSLKVEGALLRATDITVRDQRAGTVLNNDKVDIQNDDPDFEAGAKKHDFSYNVWDDWND